MQKLSEANPPKLVTLETFSIMTQTPVRTLRDFIERRIIPFVKIRTWTRIPVKEALAALELYKTEAVSLTKGEKK
jgi:hypothetical protein